MNTKIPIYRAKKIDSHEYVIGYLGQYDDGNYWIKPLPFNIGGIVISSTGGKNWSDIDITTLSIHFPYMLDSKGNEIFASLSEDGKGGDCTFMENSYNEVFMWDTFNACVVLKSKHYECKCFRNGNRKETTLNTYTVVGIHQ